MTKLIFKKSPERSTLSINREQAAKLKDITRHINDKIQSDITWSEFSKFVLEQYAEEAAKDLIYKAELEQKK